MQSYYKGYDNGCKKGYYNGYWKGSHSRRIPHPWGSKAKDCPVLTWDKPCRSLQYNHAPGVLA